MEKFRHFLAKQKNNQKFHTKKDTDIIVSSLHLLCIQYCTFLNISMHILTCTLSLQRLLRYQENFVINQDILLVIITSRILKTRPAV